jgi:hypothetical protein
MGTQKGSRMHVKIRPSGRTRKYAKQIEKPLLTASFLHALDPKTRSKVLVGEVSSVLQVEARNKVDLYDQTERYIIPLWFRVYCDLYFLLRFLPFRPSWTIELHNMA